MEVSSEGSFVTKELPGSVPAFGPQFRLGDSQLFDFSLHHLC